MFWNAEANTACLLASELTANKHRQNIELNN